MTQTSSVWCTAALMVACMSSGGSQARHARHGTQPAPRCIVFERGGCIWTCRADGTGQRRLTTSGRDSKPVWRPGGSMVAFVRADSKKETSEIWVAGADGRGARRLSPASRYSITPIWSPGGDTIVYIHAGKLPGGHWGTFLAGIRPDGTPAEPVLRLDNDDPKAFDGFDYWEACDWSPKGDKIALVHRVHLGVCVDVVARSDRKWKVAAPVRRLRWTQTVDRCVMGYSWHPTGGGHALVLAGPPIMSFGPPCAQSCCLATGETLIKDLLTVDSPDLEIGGMSPDGRSAVCSARGRIMVIDVLTSMVRDIANGKSPRWMPKLQAATPDRPKEPRP